MRLWFPSSSKVATPTSEAGPTPPAPKGISVEYAQLNAQLHASRPDYGTSGQQWAPLIRALYNECRASEILDYGCGKQTLARALSDLPVRGFDPAIPELSAAPAPADLVVCTDVLEHVEPEMVEDVLDELVRVTRKLAFVTVATRPAVKTLADGRNAHLIVQPLAWWKGRFEERFDIQEVQELPGHEFCLILRALTFDDPVTVRLPRRELSAAPASPQTKAPVAAAPANSAGAVSVLSRAGVEVRFATPNRMTQWRVESFESKEPHTVQWLDSLPPNCDFLDVGANVGMYALYVAAAKGARVFAFEPESQNFALLNQNIRLNELDGRVIAYPLALSDQAKADKLYLSDFSAGGSCHSFAEKVGFDLQPRGAAFQQGSFSISIDQMVDSGAMPVPDYIKVDVDGFEHKVIAGARKTLENRKVKGMLIELNTHLPEHREVVRHLEGLGFGYDPAQVAGALRKSGTFEGVGEYIFSRSAAHSSVDFDRPIVLRPPTSERARAVLHHMLDRVNKAQIITSPFPYLVVDEVFPPDYYQLMLDHFPTDEESRPLGETGRVPKGQYKERHCVLFNDEDFSRLDDGQRKFWNECASWLYCEEFLSFFMFKFHDALKGRIDRIVEKEGKLKLKGDALLVTDKTHYAIGPHTDAPHRLVTFLFYLPKDDSLKQFGTSVYTPKDPDFTCWGGPHYPHKDFIRQETVQFLPNRLLAFPKTERSFHGVDEIKQADISRQLLISNIRVLTATTH